jgi:hypothetical protein
MLCSGERWPGGLRGVKVSEAIWHGDQDRLQSPWDNDVASLMYVDYSKGKAIILAGYK